MVRMPNSPPKIVAGIPVTEQNQQVIAILDKIIGSNRDDIMSEEDEYDKNKRIRNLAGTARSILVGS